MEPETDGQFQGHTLVSVVKSHCRPQGDRVGWADHGQGDACEAAELVPARGGCPEAGGAVPGPQRPPRSRSGKLFFPVRGSGKGCCSFPEYFSLVVSWRVQICRPSTGKEAKATLPQTRGDVIESGFQACPGQLSPGGPARSFLQNTGFPPAKGTAGFCFQTENSFRVTAFRNLCTQSSVS